MRLGVYDEPGGSNVEVQAYIVAQDKAFVEELIEINMEVKCVEIIFLHFLE